MVCNSWRPVNILKQETRFVHVFDKENCKQVAYYNEQEFITLVFGTASNNATWFRALVPRREQIILIKMRRSSIIAATRAMRSW